MPGLGIAEHLPGGGVFGARSRTRCASRAAPSKSPAVKSLEAAARLCPPAAGDVCDPAPASPTPEGAPGVHSAAGPVSYRRSRGLPGAHAKEGHAVDDERPRRSGQRWRAAPTAPGQPAFAIRWVKPRAWLARTGMGAIGAAPLRRERPLIRGPRRGGGCAWMRSGSSALRDRSHPPPGPRTQLARLLQIPRLLLLPSDGLRRGDLDPLRRRGGRRPSVGSRSRS
jgi:hypothetical protein